jgi:hypothetical protein
MARSTGVTGSERVLRVAAAKGIAIVAIGGTFAAAAILISWPRATRQRVVPSIDAGPSVALLSSRAISVHVLELPRAISRLAPEVEATRVRTSVEKPTPLPDASASFVVSADPSPVRVIDEPPLLASRSSAYGSELIRMSNVPIDRKDPSRQAGALTRAMGTTAGAFRTAGISVAGAFKKVF